MKTPSAISGYVNTLANRTYTLFAFKYLQSDIHTYIYLYSHKHIYLNIYLYLYWYTSLLIEIYLYNYKCVHTYIHTYIHTYNKTLLADHLHRSTFPIPIASSESQTISIATIFYLPNPITSLNGPFKFGPMIGRLRKVLLYIDIYRNIDICLYIVIHIDIRVHI